MRRTRRWLPTDPVVLPPPPPPPPLTDGARWPQDEHGWEAGDAPRARPLSYPGRWPTESILLTRHARYALQLQPGRRVGRASVALGDEAIPGDGPSAISEVPLNYALLRFNAPRAAVRAPVLAVGSNGAPSQLRYKFGRAGTSVVVPMVLAEVEGLAPMFAADLCPIGYIPTTPVTGPGLSSRLFVQWLDSDQLTALDASEGGYRRVLIPAGDPDRGGVRITLPSGEVLGACYVYIDVRGHLLGDDACPLPLVDQRELLTGLLARSRRLRSLLGASADSWIDRAQEPDRREAVNQLFVAEGWVAHDTALTALADEQDAPRGGAGAPPAARATTYGDLLPAMPPPDGGRWVVATGPMVRRRGQAIVQVSRAAYDELGRPRHVSVRPVHADGSADLAHLETVARVRVDETPGAPADRVHVDYVIREALGVEVGEAVRLTPAKVRRQHWHDRIVGPPLYVTMRVQAADLVTVEREVCLLGSLTLDMLGVKSGDEVAIEGCADANGDVQQVRIKAFCDSEDLMQRREREQGGRLGALYPSARDALGVYPDLPWIFLDKTTRALLGQGSQKMGVVRVRSSRVFQLRQELREILLILVIAFLGLVELVTSAAAQGAMIAAMVFVIASAVVLRMRSRLTHRVIRSGDLPPEFTASDA